MDKLSGHLFLARESTRMPGNSHAGHASRHTSWPDSLTFPPEVGMMLIMIMMCTFLRFSPTVKLRRKSAEKLMSAAAPSGANRPVVLCSSNSAKRLN